MSSGRILSIDIMRGLTLLLMLFVNDLNMNVVPAWLGHTEADTDGMGLADWVFPGFLFIVGMSVPFALSKRLAKEEPVNMVIRHIVKRSASLIIIGVMMLNTSRVEPVLTGLSINLWAVLMYAGVFLIWNDYLDREKRFFTVAALRLTGLIILVFLIFKFNSGKPENSGSLITGWWGILGQIGWGYLVTALAYVVCRESIFKTSVVAVFFLAMNILDGSGYTGFLEKLKPVLGIIIQGNVPLIVTAGLLGGLILRKIPRQESGRLIFLFAGMAIICLGSGFFLRKWFIISKILATPSWGLICTGISFMVFILLYWIIDVRGYNRWTLFLQPAGENSLTTYLAPNILYHLIWMSGIPVLIYKQSSDPLIVIAGSLVWALLMVGLAALLARFGIRLRI
ncbi:MAG: DUF5009 domain-containing protein [Bacteroidales bacterium]|nr:DUF5009 domain-containing protein [Bacteroidales bacterium]